MLTALRQQTPATESQPTDRPTQSRLRAEIIANGKGARWAWSNDDLLRDAVGWLARLPFLCSYDLSKLLSVSETRVQRILSELDGLGWCEWVSTLIA